MAHTPSDEPPAAEPLSIRREGCDGLDDTPTDDLAEIAGERLRATGYPELRNIDCSCRRGQLILRGRVTSYFQKQLAQETLRTLPGKRSILNEVEVVSDPSAIS